jgi:hypothetical protein
MDGDSLGSEAPVDGFFKACEKTCGAGGEVYEGSISQGVARGKPKWPGLQQRLRRGFGSKVKSKRIHPAFRRAQRAHAR